MKLLGASRITYLYGTASLAALIIIAMLIYLALRRYSRRPTITVWIHGTKILPEWIFRSFDYCQPGLHHANTLQEKYFLRGLTNTLTASNPQMFKSRDTYLFGWSGKLCFDDRKKAAERLHQELVDLIWHYKKTYWCTPKIRLMCHSHGGNVALNLAAMNKSQQRYTIDELILLATPVQEQTADNIKHEMFKKIYHIFSSFDMVQVLDPQGIYKQSRAWRPLFSGRHYSPS